MASLRHPVRFWLGVWGRAIQDDFGSGERETSRRLLLRAVHPINLTRYLFQTATWSGESMRFISAMRKSNTPSFTNRYELMRVALSVTSRDGLVIEFGVGAGASISALADFTPDRTVFGFDSFEGLPEDWLHSYVRGSFSTGGQIPGVPANVKIVKGLFQDTLESFLAVNPLPVAFLHLDCDLFSSTKFVLDVLARHQRLIKGSVIQFDDFYRLDGLYPMDSFRAWKQSLIALRHFSVLGYHDAVGRHDEGGVVALQLE